MKLDWIKAEKRLKEIRQMYTDIGSSGIPALMVVINPLLVRFEKGERAKTLYNEIMKLE